MYLAFEKESDIKHEYVDGDIYAVAEQVLHNQITENLCLESKN